mgnify:CR=1 FL=1
MWLKVCCAHHQCVPGVLLCHPQGRFSPGFSMPQIIDALEKAAVDPRIKGIAVEISPLAVSLDLLLLRGFNAGATSRVHCLVLVERWWQVFGVPLPNTQSYPVRGCWRRLGSLYC